MTLLYKALFQKAVYLKLNNCCKDKFDKGKKGKDYETLDITTLQTSWEKSLL